jgi:hypothetical protein
MSTFVGTLDGARMGLREVILSFLMMNFVWDINMWVKTFVLEAFENPLLMCVNTKNYKLHDVSLATYIRR